MTLRIIKTNPIYPKAILLTILSLLVSLPVIFYYIDGSSPTKQIQNMTDSINTFTAPVRDFCLKLWIFLVDCICIPLIKTTEIVLHAIEFMQQILFHLAEYIYGIVNTICTMPIIFVKNNTDSISNVISSILFWGIQSKAGEDEVLKGEMILYFRNEQQCPADFYVTDLTKTDSFDSDLKCGPNSTYRVIISYLYFIGRIFIFPLKLVVTIQHPLSYAVFQMYAWLTYLFHLISNCMSFVSFLVFQNPEEKQNAFCKALHWCTELCFFVIIYTLKTLHALLQALEFTLRSLLPDVLAYLLPYICYIFYPVFYLILIVFSLLKTVFLITSFLLYLLSRCLHIFTVVFCNLVSLILFLFTVMLTFLISLILLAISILAIVCVVGVLEYSFNHLLLRPKSRILSFMLHIVSLFIHYIHLRRNVRECIVCFNEKELVMLRCGHNHVCHDCIQVIRRGAKKCPLCRAQL